jgi:N-acetylglutamate synthase
VFEIRPMVVTDISPALALWMGMPGITLREADTPAMLERYLIRNPGMRLVAMSADRLAGVVLAGHDGRRGYLHHVAVHETFRRRGLGRSLVEQCLGALSSEGILKCHIFVNADNADGKVFWKRLGWSERPGINLMSVTRAGETI